MVGIVFAAGDVSYCNDDEAWHKRANDTARVVKSQIDVLLGQRPDLSVHVLALGDLAYPDGTAEQLGCFKGCWSDLYNYLVPWWAIMSIAKPTTTLRHILSTSPTSPLSRRTGKDGILCYRHT